MLVERVKDSGEGGHRSNFSDSRWQARGTATLKDADTICD
jgi:hypothetical protein